MKISIILTTYNHEKFIRYAIESVLLQEIDRKLCQLIIAEDCSTDNTRNIVDSYDFSSFGEVVKLYRSSNIGLIKNYSEALSICKGKYISTISGDDFWLTANKLSSQYNRMESESICSAIYTAVNIKKTDNEVRSAPQYNEDKYFEFSDLSNLFDFPFGINASSCFFRNKDINKYLEVLQYCRIEDLPLYFFFLRNKEKILFMNEVTTCYRQHSSSLWRSFNEDNQLYSKLEALVFVNKFLYNDNLSERISFDLKNKIDSMNSISYSDIIRRIMRKLLRLITR